MLKQKLIGVLVIIGGIACTLVLMGDPGNATINLVTVPFGLYLIFTKNNNVFV